MVGHILGENALVFIGAVLDVGVFAPYAFAQALGEHFILLGIDELILQRRRACVDDKNFHVMLPYSNQRAGDPEFIGAPPRTWTWT